MNKAVHIMLQCEVQWLMDNAEIDIITNCTVGILSAMSDGLSKHITMKKILI